MWNIFQQVAELLRPILAACKVYIKYTLEMQSDTAYTKRLLGSIANIVEDVYLYIWLSFFTFTH